ncbi:hypothetical protein DMC30DRAFT_9869 [Rhodotorula diobovata]|uniref:Uncharacterized protein n=1 Tax=Rhodotorula diobovata TaxID=5288 RepID=A0A5C5G317_9BASI|nr:hypothetical protein DMC30DRAFT_9869 [Rhodotorula diobovata]
MPCIAPSSVDIAVTAVHSSPSLSLSLSFLPLARRRQGARRSLSLFLPRPRRTPPAGLAVVPQLLFFVLLPRLSPFDAPATSFSKCRDAPTPPDMRFTLFSAATALLAFAPAFAVPTGTSLEERTVGCKGIFQCRTLYRPPNSVATCINNACGYACLDGYSPTLGRLGQCTKIPTSSSSTSRSVAVSSTRTTTGAPAPSTTTTTTTSVVPAPSVTLTPNAMAAAGVTGFQGNNTNAIVSWFHTNSGQDSTNGNSWCGYPYSDAVPGFAPSLKTMLTSFGGSYETAAKAYCGLEAIVRTPEGRTATLFIADAFDDTWVRTPSSIDVVYGSFPLLFGRQTDNKLDVVKAASWTLTGRRNERYRFKGEGARGL